MAAPPEPDGPSYVRDPLLDRELSPRIRSLVTSGDVDVLIPLGSLEQHGPHLPLGTDTIIAKAIAHRLARRVGNLLVAPCLPIGCSDHHLAFAGTASIPEDVAVGYIRSAAESLLRHGFRYVFVVTGHAGNIGAMNAAWESLTPEMRERVAPFVDWPRQRKAMHDWAYWAAGLSPEEVGSHAGHFETSIMLHLEPHSVDMQAAPRGFIGPADEASARMREAGMVAVSPVGVLGDARGATAAAGETYLGILVSSLQDFVESHRGLVGED